MVTKMGSGTEERTLHFWMILVKFSGKTLVGCISISFLFWASTESRGLSNPMSWPEVGRPWELRRPWEAPLLLHVHWGGVTFPKRHLKGATSRGGERKLDRQCLRWILPKFCLPAPFAISFCQNIDNKFRSLVASWTRGSDNTESVFL